MVEGGYTVYGEKIGILMLDTKFPRIPGDIGHTDTFSFPVHYHILKGVTVRRVVKENDQNLLYPIVDAIKEMEKRGVQAVTTSCGFLAAYQNVINQEAEIPFFSSSLLQIPFVHSLIGKGKIGILTASKSSLSQQHFNGLGIKNPPVVTEGMDDMPEFTQCIIQGKEQMNTEKMKQEIVEKAKQLSNKNQDVRAIIFECTNMSPYKEAVKRSIQLPVFDINTLTNYIYQSLP